MRIGSKCPEHPVALFRTIPKPLCHAWPRDPDFSDRVGIAFGLAFRIDDRDDRTTRDAAAANHVTRILCIVRGDYHLLLFQRVIDNRAINRWIALPAPGDLKRGLGQSVGRIEC